ncbi:MAG TPA: alpha-ketoglutarate-dependent dioxygenase AlkB [Acidimicrobiales bacterium]|nr:alpha-ketoglutarate-dependent dioxygenase AlkB [Acidimicrobiales bacterium]
MAQVSPSTRHSELEALLVTTQVGLFDDLPTSIDPTFANAQRIDLDQWSWIEFVPSWVTGSDRLFRDILRTAPWEQRSRWMYTQDVTEPRLTAQYSRTSEAPQVILREIAAAFTRRYHSGYRSLWMNLYRDEHDSTAWHGDRIGRVTPNCVVPVLSLGASRRFLIRPLEGGKSMTFHPGAGDLIVMGGRCQVEWVHSVPKQATPSGARISINFKPTALRRS